MFLNTQHSLGYCVAKVSKTKFPCKSCPCGNEILLFANWRKSGPGGFFKVKASRSQRRRTYSRADEATETPTTTGTPIKPHLVGRRNSVGFSNLVASSIDARPAGCASKSKGKKHVSAFVSEALNGRGTKSVSAGDGLLSL